MERYLLRVTTILMAWLAAVSLASAQTAVEYIHTDALGTPVAVTNSAGAVIERSVYEPYGQLINRPLTDGPGFTGHLQDATTGLTYMQQRYYDSQLGAFLSVDPVNAYGSPVGQFNRYRYANNNPYAFLDPDGRLPCRVSDPKCDPTDDPIGQRECAKTCLGDESRGRGKVSDAGDDALLPMKDRSYEILSKPAGPDGVTDLNSTEFGQLLEYEFATVELRSKLRGGFANLPARETMYELRWGPTADSLFYGEFGGTKYRLTLSSGRTIGPYVGGDFNYIKQGILMSQSGDGLTEMRLLIKAWNSNRWSGTPANVDQRLMFGEIGYLYSELRK